MLNAPTLIVSVVSIVSHKVPSTTRAQLIHGQDSNCLVL
jgi:hypothetical protein